MPDFTFQGHAAGMYPMLRDVYDQPAGTVTPGDVLRLEHAPDQDWVPCEEDGSGTDSGTDSSSEPDPPASTPRQASKTGHDDDTAGQPGSEEN